MTTSKKTTSKPNKSTTKKAATKPVTTASKRAPAKKTVAPKKVAAATPTYDEIARRAYALFEARGFEHGHDVDDWRTAEAELTRGI